MTIITNVLRSIRQFAANLRLKSTFQERNDNPKTPPASHESDIYLDTGLG
ncbi:MAG: hypothetical protein KTR16_10240 [Acidiferrobacterales bacterium]|nr:hypothetical protein [Acidiferrobacterales bacterium]